MLRRLSCVLVVGALAGTAVGGEAPLDLATRIPADTVVYVRTDYALVHNFIRSNLARRILEDPQVRPAIAPLFGLIQMA